MIILQSEEIQPRVDTSELPLALILKGRFTSLLSQLKASHQLPTESTYYLSSTRSGHPPSFADHYLALILKENQSSATLQLPRMEKRYF